MPGGSGESAEKRKPKKGHGELDGLTTTAGPLDAVDVKLATGKRVNQDLFLLWAPLQSSLILFDETDTHGKRW